MADLMSYYKSGCKSLVTTKRKDKDKNNHSDGLFTFLLEGAAAVGIANSGYWSVAGRSSEIKASEPDRNVVRGIRRGVSQQPSVPSVDVLQGSFGVALADLALLAILVENESSHY